MSRVYRPPRRRDLHAVARQYWGDRSPPAAMLGDTRSRACALCGRPVFNERESVLEADGNPTPAGVHPCLPCVGWHHLHATCADLRRLICDDLRSDLDALEFAELVVCPDAVRVADALMGEWSSEIQRVQPRGRYA